MGDPVVSFIIKEVSAFITSEVKLVRGVKKELKYIKDELEAMNIFLEIAEEKQKIGRGERQWVKKVRELAYDVEDFIEEFKICHHLIKLSSGLGVPRCFNFIIYPAKTLKAQRWAGKEIQKIKIDVKEAMERAQKYGFVSGTNREEAESSGSAITTSSVSHPDPRRMNALFVNEADLVGINKPRDKLLEWLLDENEPRCRVISVVGTGGLGKTTLIKKIHDSPTLMNEGHFSCRVWITVSESFVWKEFLKQMHKELFSIFPAEEEFSEESKIIGKIRDCLEILRYVIVFDDIWSVFAWESIKIVLPDNNNGSRVMVTTRDKRVADTCCSSPHNHNFVYELETLSDEQSRNLFCKRVFAKSNCPPDLEGLSFEFLRKCNGLPLAIVTIGGLLASKRNNTKEEWQKLLDHLDLELKDTIINQILNLSYKELPYHFKKCFLYLSIFPHDCEIRGELLQSLWIAEGLTTADRGKTAEDVAQYCFEELISRSMILPVTTSYLGRVETIQVHDIMHAFIVSKSAEEDLVFVLGISKIPQGMIRRLSISTGNSSEQISQIEERLNHVRTFTVFHADKLHSSIFSKLRFLRVLHLEICCLDSRCIHEISKLHHLKYLELMEVIFTEATTMFLGDLPNLEVLKVLHSSCLEVAPKIFLGEHPNLEVLDVTGTDLSLVIPSVSNYRKLRSLTCHYAFAAFGGIIERLKALQTLDFWVKYEEDIDFSEVKKLGSLTQLRNLHARQLNERVWMDFAAFVTKISNQLCSLSFHSSSDSDILCLIMNSLSSPPLFLQSLCLDGHLSELPGWIGMLKNVTKIFLMHSGFKDDAFQVLKHLPNLNLLSLHNNAYVGENLCFDGEGFTSLKVLELSWLENLKSLIFGYGAMPALEVLRISDCSSLENYAQEYFPNLKHIKIMNVFRALGNAPVSQPKMFNNIQELSLHSVTEE